MSLELHEAEEKINKLLAKRNAKEKVFIDEDTREKITKIIEDCRWDCMPDERPVKGVKFFVDAILELFKRCRIAPII